MVKRARSCHKEHFTLLRPALKHEPGSPAVLLSTRMHFRLTRPAKSGKGNLMTRRSHLLRGILLASAACGAISVAETHAADRWIEVRSPHFVVVSNAGEKEARRIAEHFEIFRSVVQRALPKLRVDPGQPFIIMAAKNESALKLLIPQYWEKKGNVHPTGVFVAGQDKHYIALRLDTESENPYHVIYHEYVHLVVNLNFAYVPVWLDEGLAEFYANAEIGRKEVGVGRPAPVHLQLLERHQLLPLEVLLNVTPDSPQYNEADTASVFYAEAWALTHYMMLDNKTGHTKELATYLDQIQQGLNAKQAFQQNFGDLKKFEQKLDLYTQQETYYYASVKVPTMIDVNSFASRELAPAEVAAAEGDLHVHMGRPVEARTALQQATQLDPILAAPRESLGILALHEGHHEEALKWFQEAVALDSKNFLTHYYYAWLSSEGGELTPERIEIAESGLRKAIELNPNFAPAYAALSQFYVVRHDHLDDALSLARKAAELEPGTLTHHLAVAIVLMALDKGEEAQRLAQRVLDAARTPGERTAARQVLDSLRTYQARHEEKKRYEEQMRQRAEQQQKITLVPKSAAAGAESSTPTVRRPENAAQGGDEAKTPAPAQQAKVELPPEPPKQTAPAEGRVAALSCQGKTLDLTLEYYGFKISLHAEDVTKIEFTSSSNLPKNFDPCVGLKGRSVKAEYTIVKRKRYAGEIVSLELEK